MSKDYTKGLRASPVTGEAINSKKMHYAMVELDALEYMGDLIRRSPKSAQMLVTLIRLMPPSSGGVIVISRETMRELLQCSMPSVDRSLKLLMEEGWVQRIRIGGASALAINHRVAWIGDRGEIQHAVFGATVVASRSEQDALSLNPPKAKNVPIAHSDEEVITSGAGMAPPSQPSLPNMEAVIRTKDEATRNKLEADGQQRLID